MVFFIFSQLFHYVYSHGHIHRAIAFAPFPFLHTRFPPPAPPCCLLPLLVCCLAATCQCVFVATCRCVSRYPLHAAHTPHTWPGIRELPPSRRRAVPSSSSPFQHTAPHGPTLQRAGSRNALYFKNMRRAARIRLFRARPKRFFCQEKAREGGFNWHAADANACAT